MKIYVLTREENRYDQCGEYFECAFFKEPSIDDVRRALNLSGNTDEDFLSHIKNGGGRRGDEEIWYYLRAVETIN